MKEVIMISDPAPFSQLDCKVREKYFQGQTQWLREILLQLLKS